jgi:hypothetical protein
MQEIAGRLILMLNDQIEKLTQRLSNARDIGDLPFRTESLAAEYKY